MIELSNDEINSKIASLAGDSKVVNFNTFLPEKILGHIEYATDLNEALNAARRIANKTDYTFVLTFTNDKWKASFGDYLDCSEYTGFNPAYCICMAILQFYGKT